MKVRNLVVIVGVTAALAACITVNIYFPAPEVREAAEKIVDETWGEGASTEPVAPGQSGAGKPSWFSALGPAPAYGADIDINVSTAAIRTLIANEKKRAKELKPYLSAGSVGIGRNGMLVVRNLDNVPLREQATIRRLVEAENRNRESLYREIAKANDFGDDRVPEIQRIFAETWIKKAEKGWWVQKPDGTWAQK